MPPTLIATLAMGIVAGTGFVVMPHWLNLFVPLPPAFLVVSLAFMIFVLALARGRRGFFLNGFAALMGRVSFSAYLLHVAVLKVVAGQPLLGDVFRLTGWSAVVAFAVTLVCVILIVLAGSWCAYRLIEIPMIGCGKALIRRRRLAVP